MPVISHDKLKELCLRIFEAAGATGDEAECVADHLVKSNLVGHDSHGVVRLPQYFKRIDEGRLKFGAKIEIIRETPSTALINGNWGFGQVIAKRAMEIAIEKARKCSISSVGIINCNHIGRLGEYPMMAAKAGMIGFVVCNGGGIAGMPPYGGLGPIIGVNPMSAGVPAGDMTPFLLDFANTVVSEGKVRVKHQSGEPVPDGWLVDKNGKPTNNPADLYDGGAILPSGGHKGYSLGVLVDILGGALTGAGCSTPSKQWKGGNGTLMIVIDVAAFSPLKEFKARVDSLFRTIKETPKAPGFSEILIPGEPEAKTEEERLKKGIFIADKTWQEIMKISEKLKVNSKEIIEKSPHDRDH